MGTFTDTYTSTFYTCRFNKHIIKCYKVLLGTCIIIPGFIENSVVCTWCNKICTYKLYFIYLHTKSINLYTEGSLQVLTTRNACSIMCPSRGGWVFYVLGIKSKSTYNYGVGPHIIFILISTYEWFFVLRTNKNRL